MKLYETELAPHLFLALLLCVLVCTSEITLTT